MTAPKVSVNINLYYFFITTLESSSASATVLTIRTRASSRTIRPRTVVRSNIRGWSKHVCRVLFFIRVCALRSKKSNSPGSWPVVSARRSSYLVTIKGIMCYFFFFRYVFKLWSTLRNGGANDLFFYFF